MTVYCTPDDLLCALQGWHRGCPFKIYVHEIAYTGVDGRPFRLEIHANPLYTPPNKEDSNGPLS